MISKYTLGIVLSIGSLITIGLCIYLDRKRRLNPNYKLAIREKRKAESLTESKTESGNLPIPDLQDLEAVQNYFLAEVEIGDDLLNQGDIDGAVEHLCRAVAVCNYPQRLLEIIQPNMSTHVFHLLLERLPAIGQWIHNHQVANFGSFSPEDYYSQDGGTDNNQNWDET